jgi:molybdate transport system ATP-binding protein
LRKCRSGPTFSYRFQKKKTRKLQGYKVTMTKTMTSLVCTRIRIGVVGRNAYRSSSCARLKGPWIHARSRSHGFSTTNTNIKNDIDSVDADASITRPLIELKGARLSYPSRGSTSTSTSSSKPSPPVIDFVVHPPTAGGHVILGRNGKNKTLLSQVLVKPGNYLEEGTFSTQLRSEATIEPGRMRQPPDVAHVSFQSHEALLEEGGTTSKAILGQQGGTLTGAARFLTVRFGLFPFLARDVRTLSTGEIRKVLLVKALAERPRLLILDHAFDGLDVASRQALQELISKTLRGFRPDILVQGVDARATAHTQVVLVSHRPQEEMVDEMETVSVFRQDGSLQTMQRQGRTGEEIFRMAERTMMMTAHEEIEGNTVSGSHPSHEEQNSCWNDPTLPSLDEVASWWSHGKEAASSEDSSRGTVVHAENLYVQRGEAILLHGLNWKVSSEGKRWLIAGGNGAGKSTLSRLLAKQEDNVIREDGSLSLFFGNDDIDNAATSHHDDVNHGILSNRRPGVGWFSTELHLALARSDVTARQILCGSTSSSGENTIMSSAAESVAEWLFLDNKDNDSDDSDLLSRPFSQLSQGEQKLTLIASALASRPTLCVLDEPCQGLDQIHRRRVLALVERIMQATDMNLVYITHHMEEVPPSVTHVLHLREGRDVYNGNRDEYNPDHV